MTLSELYEQEQARLAAVAAARKVVDDALAEYHRARDRLAYATRKNYPEPALQQARQEAHDTRLAWQKARRALMRAL